ncbi:hypothetical protein [Bacillus sp. AFS037270]|uniref:hypothetical protein n=1 Tax=Bacillus sp. AFS037270 TaxID=2033499 RepID=UPI000BFD7F89|nr:hypothetical protein [Bacillus sp. AFS037270]PGV52477.1 hypothetical protein COD92_09765 [Bacillus sp. AFS037270]
MKLKDIIETILFRFGINPNKGGWTTYYPVKIIPEYTVDLEKGQVTGKIIHNQKEYMTVIVDVPNNKTKVIRKLRGLAKIIKPHKKHHYINIIKDEAEYFIENQITDPKSQFIIPLD